MEKMCIKQLTQSTSRTYSANLPTNFFYFIVPFKHRLIYFYLHYGTVNCNLWGIIFFYPININFQLLLPYNKILSYFIISAILYHNFCALTTEWNYIKHLSQNSHKDKIERLITDWYETITISGLFTQAYYKMLIQYIFL